jgi:hypothetical protein
MRVYDRVYCVTYALNATTDTVLQVPIDEQQQVTRVCIQVRIGIDTSMSMTMSTSMSMTDVREEESSKSKTRMRKIERMRSTRERGEGMWRRA